MPGGYIAHRGDKAAGCRAGSKAKRRIEADGGGDRLGPDLDRDEKVAVRRIDPGYGVPGISVSLMDIDDANAGMSEGGIASSGGGEPQDAAIIGAEPLDLTRTATLILKSELLHAGDDDVPLGIHQHL